MFAVFDDASPLVEPLSIDEAFLDVRGMRRIAGSPAEIAARLRRDVRERVGLPITVGVARTKFLAKVASGVAKPDGLLVVEPDRELAFLHPLAVERLWGVGPATARKLHAVRLATVGDVAGLSEETLIALLGRASGRQLYALSRNHDARRVRPGRRRGSIGAQRALGRSSKSPEALDATLVALVDRITRRMRAAGRVGRTVVLRLRFGDFTRGDAQSHAAALDGADARDPRDGARAARGGPAGDRGARPDARRHLGRQPRERRCRPARAAVRRRRAGRGRLGGRRRAQPLRHRPRSPAACSSAGTAGSRCRTCRTRHRCRRREVHDVAERVRDARRCQRRHGGRLAAPQRARDLRLLPRVLGDRRPRLEADVAAACEGLLAGGADELVVLDNHGGNRINVTPESCRPAPGSSRGTHSISARTGWTRCSTSATTRVAASTAFSPTPTCPVSACGSTTS